MERDGAAAAETVWAAWQAGERFETLPDAQRPADRREGYRIQALLAALSARPVVGWKIAATSAAGQRHINVGGPLIGRLLAERVHPAGADVPFGANAMAVAEPEFCFRMARDLPPRAEPYGVAEVLDAVAALHLAIELPDSRFRDFTKAGEAQLLADNACAHEFVLGPEAPALWRDLDLAAHRVSGRVVGGPVHEGGGFNVLGDPRVALAWAANELSGLGISLKAGEIVTTGTCVVPIPIARGDRVEMDFGSLGTVACRLV